MMLKTQYYKVQIKGKVEHLGVVAIENRAFRSPSTVVASFTYFFFIYVFK